MQVNVHIVPHRATNGYPSIPLVSVQCGTKVARPYVHIGFSDSGRQGQPHVPEDPHGITFQGEGSVVAHALPHPAGDTATAQLHQRMTLDPPLHPSPKRLEQQHVALRAPPIRGAFPTPNRTPDSTTLATQASCWTAGTPVTINAERRRTRRRVPGCYRLVGTRPLRRSVLLAPPSGGRGSTAR